MKTITNNPLYSFFNYLYFYWRRNKWIALFPFKNRLRRIYIDRPIFLIGNQGDGLTLLSRMLRRNSSVISVSGNSEYWAGASEMQNAYDFILDSSLSGIRTNIKTHSKLSPPRSWSYACNELIDKYRNTEEDFNESISTNFRTAIQIAIYLNAKGVQNPRFIDKSQVFSVKMAYIASLLEPTKSYFIHVTRNPYATIYRAASGKAGDMNRYSKFMSFEDRFQICLEHWLNTAKCVEMDKFKVSNFLRIRFEDLLYQPRLSLKKICNFVDLDFDDDMIPSSNHKIPFGSKYRDRWYPLRSNVNDYYLSHISDYWINKIIDHCSLYAENFGYFPPNF